jgi:hypothetical protein
MAGRRSWLAGLQRTAGVGSKSAVSVVKVGGFVIRGEEETLGFETWGIVNEWVAKWSIGGGVALAGDVVAIVRRKP